MKQLKGKQAMHVAMKKSSHVGHSIGKDIAKGTMVGAIVKTGGKLMSNATKHPVVVFGLGIVAGYVIYKYRKDIISNTNKVVGAGKDFVQHQKENLEDIVAEAKETD